MPKWTNEQLDAITKSGTNIIVSAGAGSGKTEVLSERVIDKLKNGIHIDELLILTFTKAAAEEMKDRIRSKIKKDETLKEELIRIESAYITTFDSFALSVVKKYHYLMNIKSDIDITDGSILDIITTKMLDEVFLEYYTKEDENFLKFIDKYSVKNDKEIRNNFISLIKHIDGILDKESYIQHLETNMYSDESINAYIEKFIGLFESKKKNLQRAFEELSHYFDEKYLTKVETVILNVINSDFGRFVSLSPQSIPAVPQNTEPVAKSKKEELNNVYKELMSLQNYGGRELLRNDILSTKEDVEEICTILKNYYKKIDEYKKEHEIYSFQDIAKLAIDIFKNHESARLEIKNAIKEIMIDEYQDTNDIQEEFISLIANDNVYMVGDVKQSIYQFRGSNPSIFKDKYYNYSDNNGGQKIDLVKNFRSREEVLNNINSIFSLLMDKDLGGADYLQSHAMEFGNNCYVENKEDYNYNFKVLEYEREKNFEYSKAEIEIFTIAQDIQNKIKTKMKVYDKKLNTLREFKYSDAVIILDRSKYFDDYKKIFEYLNIPLTILKDGKLNANIDIEIIKNIIDIIIHIKNADFNSEFKFDFMSIGRSFLYEYSDQYLFDIVSENKYEETTLFKDFNSIDNYNSMNPYQLFSYILDITDFYNKIYKIGDYENINVRLSAISDIARNFSEKGYTIEDFLAYLNEIIGKDLKIEYKEWSSNSDSVKIMTVHKSKGLEFPICYFADLDHKFNDDELKSKFIANKDYGIISPLPDDKENFIKALYKNDYHTDEVSEKIRLFYVALTRAKEEFIIVLPTSDEEKAPKNEFGTIDYEIRKRITKTSEFVYLIKPYLQKYFYDVNVAKLGLSKNYLYNRTSNIYKGQTLDKIKVEEINIENEPILEKHYSKDSLALIDKNVIKNMTYGTKVHEILEYIDFKNYDESVIEDGYIRKQITKFVQSLDNLDNANIIKEYEFYYEKDNISRHGIIDLLIEYDNHIDIIDYKLSNTKDDKYKDQILGYREYIESVSNKPVKTSLYSIIKGELEEI